MRFTRFFLLFLLPISLNPAFAATGSEQYGLPAPTISKLHNGMQVLVHPQPGSRTVHIRLAVNAGHYTASCDKQQTAHFAEHILFMGDKQLTESQIETEAKALGARWNATTKDHYTVYKMRGPVENLAQLIRLWRKMLDHISASDRQVEVTRKILATEMDHGENLVTRLLYPYIGEKGKEIHALKSFLPDHRGLCDNYPSYESVTPNDVRQFVKRYYTPGNMVLIVVGDIDTAQTIPLIQETFASLPGNSVNRPPDHDSYTGRISPRTITRRLGNLYGEAAEIQYMYPLNQTHPDQLAHMAIFADILKSKLYDVLRSKSGLAYSPGSRVRQQSDLNFFEVSWDTSADDIVKSRSLADQVIKGYVEHGLSDEEFEVAQRVLLGVSQSLSFDLSNLSSYYVSMSRRYPDLAEFRHLDRDIATAKPYEVNNTLKQYINQENRLALINKRLVPVWVFYTALILAVFWVLIEIKNILNKRARKKNDGL